MESCSKIILGNIEIATLTDNESSCKNLEKICEEDAKSGSQLQDLEIKIIKELIKEKTASSEPITPNTDKKVKIKKIKIRRSRGEKRKCSDKTESCKKLKRNKKDEKVSSVEQSIPTMVEVTENSTPVGMVTPKAPIKNSLVVDNTENDSDVENREIQVKEKSKQMSARKSKAVTNACRETLEVLLGFGLDTLGSMDKSLKMLDSHNCLNNKFISIDTLMDLIGLAMELIGKDKSHEDMDVEKEANLLRIVSKLATEISKTPKVSKAKQNIMAASVSPKSKVNNQEETPTVSAPVNEGDEKILENVSNLEQEEKMEECESIVEPQPKDEGQAVAKSGNNFCITNYFKKLKKTVEDKNTNERFSSFTTKTDMYMAPKLGGELTGQRREKFEEEFKNQNCKINYLIEQNAKQLEKKSNCETSKKKSSIPEPEIEKKEEIAESTDAFQKMTCEVIELEDSNDAKTTSTEITSSSTIKVSDQPARKKVALLRVDQQKVQPIQGVSRTKAKLLQFHDNRRPPYWGTWRRKSSTIGPRKPFGKDKIFNYEVDSDDEWEGEEEPGESLHGSDDEKEPEEDYEVDNDFFVPHGYLSDDENPEKENMSPKTKLNLMEEQFSSELSQKTRKMTPLVFGTFWIHKGPPPEGNLFQDLQLERLHIFPWVSTPIQIEEEEKSENLTESGEPSSQLKKSRRVTFPAEEIPQLIKIIHGSPQNSEFLAKKFLLYWNTEKLPDVRRPNLTKSCVLKKIKELAARQSSQETGKMCWLVPKETRQEFGAEVEVEEAAKKPRKCFIWKFIKKADKTTGVVQATSDTQEPEVVILES